MPCFTNRKKAIAIILCSIVLLLPWLFLPAKITGATAKTSDMYPIEGYVASGSYQESRTSYAKRYKIVDNERKMTVYIYVVENMPVLIETERTDSEETTSETRLYPSTGE